MANREQVIHVEMNTNEIKNASEDLEKALLALRVRLGKLKAEINAALAPLGAVFVPMVNQAVGAATRLVKSVGKVIRTLLGYGAVARSTAKAQKALASANEKTERSLMGFDEVNRLDGVSGKVTQTTAPSEIEMELDKLSIPLQILVEKIRSIIAPLREIDFTPAVEAFGRLKTAIASIGRTLFTDLEWAWHTLLVPLSKWSVESFLPAFLDAIGAALRVLNSVVVALKPAAEWLLENFLRPLAQWTGERLLAALGWLTEKLKGISGWISENQELVQKIALATAAIALINGVLGNFNNLSSTAISAATGFGNTTGWLANPVSLVGTAVKALCTVLLLLIGNWDGVKSAAVAVWSTIQSVWSGAAEWFRQKVLTPLSNGFKGMVNGIIGFFNGLISGVVTAVNSIVGAVNKLHFTVPNWVPGLGGKQLGFQLKPVSAPQIPYLARGAVLPANKPFMAVVGDQHHGTNVEAPLATIQEAVALVMGDQTAAILAGFETSVGVQREILEAVLGIQIGDDLIGNAVARYQRKMAVVNGGLI